MDPPNIVLVSIDSLRADHCGYLGDDRGLTPALDDLAGAGVAFRNAITPGPQTYSSMPVIFSGYHPPTDAVSRSAGADHWERRLAAIDRHLARFGSLPADLARLGYSTGAVTPNPWTGTAAGFDRGFERFADVSTADGEGWVRRAAARVPGLDADGRSVELLSNMLSGTSFFAQWETLYDDVRAVRDALSEPYFLWVFLLDTHFPFVAARSHREEQTLPALYYTLYRASRAMRGNADSMPESVRAAVQRSYRDAVRAADSFLATLRSDLAEDDPVVAVHADHGESFGDHGEYGHNRAQVYEENVHVPYVVANAGVRDAVAAPTSLATVRDTIRTVARVGTFDPARATSRHVVTASEDGANTAVRGARFKYVDAEDGRFLFDLHRDPAESRDVASEHPDRVPAFRRRLAAFERERRELDRLGRAADEAATHDGL